jgi:hypothetical protein
MEMQPGGQMPELNELPVGMQFPADSFDAVEESSEITEPNAANVANATDGGAIFSDTGKVAPELSIAESAQQKVQKTLQNFDVTTDWRKVVEAYIAGAEGMDLDRIKALYDTCASAITAEDVQERLAAAADADALRETLAAEGYALPADEQGEPTEMFPAGSGQTAIGDARRMWVRQSSQGLPYVSDERLKSLEVLMPFEALNKLRDGIRAFCDQEEETALHNLPAAALASELEDKTAELFGEFKANDKASLDAVEPVTLEITGTSLLEEHVGMTQGELRRWLAFRHPETFLRGLTSISFVEDIEVVPGLSDSPDGRYHEGTASIEIKVSATDNPATIIQKLNHEFIHHAHSNRMTIEMLSEWDDIINEEDVDVTSYVTESREKANGRMEDMADSGRLYFANPSVMREKAPQRFAWFQKYYHRWF